MLLHLAPPCCSQPPADHPAALIALVITPACRQSAVTAAHHARAIAGVYGYRNWADSTKLMPMYCQLSLLLCHPGSPP